MQHQGALTTFDFSRQSMQPDVDGLHPEMSKITLLCKFEQIPLIVSYVFLLQCAWLDLSGLLFQSGLSSALATWSVKKSLYLRPVWYAFVWITLGLFVVQRIAAGQSIDKDFVFQFSHTYLLFKGVIMSGKDYRQRKPPVRQVNRR